MKFNRLILLLILVIVAVAIQGCQSGGNVSEADIQRNAKATDDFVKNHPPDPDSHTQN